MTLYIYGVLAVFFAKHFFPPGNDNLALLASLAVFWFGFILRPFGAIFFGHLGDLIGRKFTFMLTLGMMGLATFLIGCIPSYETWGIAAPILILLMRAMQGLALGGEYAVLRPTSRSTHQTAGTAFMRAGFNLPRHRIRVARLLSLRDAGTALPRSDEALKIKF